MPPPPRSVPLPWRRRSPPPQPNPVVQVVSGLLAAIGIAPGASNGPAAPVSPSTVLGALALIRRELQHTFANQAPNLPDTTSLTVNENSSKTITMPATDADGDTLHLHRRGQGPTRRTYPWHRHRVGQHHHLHPRQELRTGTRHHR